MTSIPNEILLLKFGPNTYTNDGVVCEFMFDRADATIVCNEFMSRQRDLVIDYEHQTLQGSEAPAAGWIQELCLKDDGLYGIIKCWNERAETYLTRKEYRYFSPVILMKDQHVIALHSVALTNHPAIHGITPLSNSDQKTPSQNEEKWDTLLQKFNCATIELLEAKMDTLIQEQHAHQYALADQLVQKAIASGKLSTQQHDWARQQALNDFKGFQKFIEELPNRLPGPAQNQNIQLNDSTSIQNFSDEALHILKMSGCSETQIQNLMKGNYNV